MNTVSQLAISEDSFERELSIMCGSLSRTSHRPEASFRQASNDKRLICNSVTSDGSVLNQRENFICCHGPKCSYAHSLEEQRIDEKKLSIYRSILDKDQTLAISEDPASYAEIYRGFIAASSICERCYSGECTGGYNCRNGACCHDLLICRDDLLTGCCTNEIHLSKLSSRTIEKFRDMIALSESYPCCSNGHHLSQRNVPSYGIFLIEMERQQGWCTPSSAGALSVSPLMADTLSVGPSTAISDPSHPLVRGSRAESVDSNLSDSDISLGSEIDEILATMSSDEDY